MHAVFKVFTNVVQLTLLHAVAEGRCLLAPRGSADVEVARSPQQCVMKLIHLITGDGGSRGRFVTVALFRGDHLSLGPSNS